MEGDEFVSVDVSVLEVRNILPRTDWTAHIESSLKGQKAGLSMNKALPRGRVTVTVGKQIYESPALKPGLNPSLPRNSTTFANVALKSKLTVQVGAQRPMPW